MVSHNEHKAFHGLEAKKVMQRDESGSWDDNKYRYIHMAGKASEDIAPAPQNDSNENVVTIISQVYVTEPKTFPGPATYVTKFPVTETLGGGAQTTQNSYESAKSAINQPKTRTGADYITPTYAGDGFTPTAVKGRPLSHPEYIAQQQDQGMSGGEKAGVAIGVLAALALVAGLILFCIRRRKKQMENRGERLDEKHASKTSFFSGTAAAVGAPAGEKRASFKSLASSHSAATAPRLSLRPVASFLPGILENDKSTGDKQLNVPAMSQKPRSGSPQNPFSDANEKQPTNPFDEGDGKANHSATPSWGSGEAGTPQVGTAAAVPITAAGAAGAASSRGSNNVHRVQLDFKPSMDDELELKSGQLVRMVHEYDDGWTLCMRMDRSQQGVCPRTCLSKLPVKPRPQGPNGRGSPPGFRGPPPQGPNKMMPRPLTPTGRERSNTAGGSDASPTSQEANRTRSQSVTQERSNSPTDSGVPARKPVAGQAM